MNALAWARIGSGIMSVPVPRQLTKLTDKLDHAPYRAEFLKLTTLRHYRKQHQDLEGAWDPMEGKSRVASSLGEMYRRHRLQNLPNGARKVETEVTYQTGDASLIYCASRSTDRLSRHEQWQFASRIHDVPKFALTLRVAFARKRDAGRHASVTGLARLEAAVCGRALPCLFRLAHGTAALSPPVSVFRARGTPSRVRAAIRPGGFRFPAAGYSPQGFRRVGHRQGPAPVARRGGRIRARVRVSRIPPRKSSGLHRQCAD